MCCTAATLQTFNPLPPPSASTPLSSSFPAWVKFARTPYVSPPSFLGHSPECPSRTTTECPRAASKLLLLSACLFGYEARFFPGLSISKLLGRLGLNYSPNAYTYDRIMYRIFDISESDPLFV